MRVIIPCQFEIQPRPGQSPRQCLAAARGIVVSWIQRYFTGAGVGELKNDRARLSLQGGHEIIAETHECASHQLATIDWLFPEPVEPRLSWKFSWIGACDARGVQTAILIGQEPRTLQLFPGLVNLAANNPFSTVNEVWRQLVTSWKCTIEGQTVPVQARTLKKGRVEWFVEEIVMNPKRVLPIALIILGEKRLTVDEGALQQTQLMLPGLAQVIALADDAAYEAFKKQFHSVPIPADTVVAVMWPGCSRKSSRPIVSTHWNVQQMQAALGGGALHNLFSNAIFPVAVDRYTEGPLIRAARAALTASPLECVRPDRAMSEKLTALQAELQQMRAANERLEREHNNARRHVHALLDNLADVRLQLKSLRTAPPQPDQSDARFQELAGELERAWDENKRLQDEKNEAQRQAKELETDFRNFLNNPAAYIEPGEPSEAASSGAPADKTHHDFDSVADALRIATAEFSDAIAVWEDAEKSAKDSVFGSPGRVYQALQAIAEVARVYFKAKSGGPPLGPIERAFLQRVPFKYTSFESPTTLSLFGADRVFHDQGQSRLMTRHLTLGGGGANTCLQIYFEFDDATQRALIGYCGRHLPYSTQRT